MDTDELSNETYNAILIEAEKFNHDLTLQFGVLASSCKNEKEYLRNAKLLIKNWQFGQIWFRIYVFWRSTIKKSP